MFLKINDELLNYENLQHYEYENNILSIFFNGSVGTKIEQDINQFNDFINLIYENKNIIRINGNRIGFNLKNISGITDQNKNLIVYFIDGTSKTFVSLKLKDIEKQILGE